MVPSTSTDVRFTTVNKSDFLKQLYDKEERSSFCPREQHRHNKFTFRPFVKDGFQIVKNSHNSKSTGSLFTNSTINNSKTRGVSSSTPKQCSKQRVLTSSSHGSLRGSASASRLQIPTSSSTYGEFYPEPESLEELKARRKAMDDEVVDFRAEAIDSMNRQKKQIENYIEAKNRSMKCESITPLSRVLKGQGKMLLRPAGAGVSNQNQSVDMHQQRQQQQQDSAKKATKQAKDLWGEDDDDLDSGCGTSLILSRRDGRHRSGKGGGSVSAPSNRRPAPTFTEEFNAQHASHWKVFTPKDPQRGGSGAGSLK